MIEFSMLLINNNRSKAYLQNLVKNGYIPKKIIYLETNQVLPEHTENDSILSIKTEQKFIRKLDRLNISFDEKKHILSTISEVNIPFVRVNSIDINSNAVIREVSVLESEYVIYSGPGGAILRHELLNTGKKFIHVHPGILPKYRGSTTIYYSMLIENSVGASVILLDENIDEGPILHQEEYEFTERNIDFDYVLDPLLRAKVLVGFLKKDNTVKRMQKNNSEANTFYIIHPLLKHSVVFNNA